LAPVAAVVTNIIEKTNPNNNSFLFINYRLRGIPFKDHIIDH
jgi:hypothetical protein